MDTRLTGASAITSAAPTRIEAVPVRQAVRTELAAPNAVAAMAGTEQSRWNRGTSPGPSSVPSPAGLQTTITVEPQSGNVIFRLIDASSGTAILQSPSESILKLRAYVRALQFAQPQAASQPGTEA